MTKKPAKSARERGQSLRVIVLTVPGLADVAGTEVAAIPGARVTDAGNDGRADVVLATVPPAQAHSVRALRTAEDVFVEVGRTLRDEGDRAGWISNRLWRPSRAEQALTTWSALAATSGRGRRRTMTYRVIARVRQERSFPRTQLRNQLAKLIGSDRPGWQVADPARLEVWALEYAPGRFVAGLRLTDASMRQRDGRVVERSGALRPAVAAAMVRSATSEPESELPDRLLDPCCGSGTILAEARALGWRAIGRDLDPEAVDASRHNVPDASVAQGDARDLRLPEGHVGACVSNLPFGRQYDVPTDTETWLRAVLSQCAHVTAAGGAVVLLAPTIPRATVPTALRLRGRQPLRLLGTKTTMWHFVRE